MGGKDLNCTCITARRAGARLQVESKLATLKERKEREGTGCFSRPLSLTSPPVCGAAMTALQRPALFQAQEDFVFDTISKIDGQFVGANPLV
jgi:hypothetical protein